MELVVLIYCRVSFATFMLVCAFWRQTNLQLAHYPHLMRCILHVFVLYCGVGSSSQPNHVYLQFGVCCTFCLVSCFIRFICFRRRSPSPYYSRGGYRSRSRSRSYSPRKYRRFVLTKHIMGKLYSYLKRFKMFISMNGNENKLYLRGVWLCIPSFWKV